MSWVAPVLAAADVPRVVVDFVDSPTLWADRLAAPSGRARLRARYVRWLTRRWEAALAGRVAHSLYISPVDAAVVAGDRPPGARVTAIPNGVRTDAFDAAPSALPSPNIGFLGNLAYEPNEEAVLWLHEQVFVPLARELPRLSLVLIGRGPTDRVRALAADSRVVLTGGVDNIWPWVKSVDVFVIPLWAGGGIKNKILEAMYAARPVVTTPIGNEGIDGVDGVHLRLASDARGFLDAARSLISDAETARQIGVTASEMVRQRFDWSNLLPRFERAILGPDD